MGIRTVVLLVGSAVAAAMVTYLVVQEVAQQLPTAIRIALVIVVAVAAFGLAWWGAGSKSEDAQEENPISLIDAIEAEKDVDVENIKVTGEHKGQTNVIHDISSTGGSVRVKNVVVNSRRNDDE